jgi:septal ring factor EnvC (AmiA/AmiB activator)
MRRVRRNSLLPLIALIAVAAHPGGPDKEAATRKQIEQAEQARAAEQAAQQAAAARAAAAAAEEQRLAASRIAAAARLREAETATAEAADRMDRLVAERRQAQEGLDARASMMQPLLPLIERLSLFPAETLLAVPGKPEDTLRGVLVLHGLASELEQEATALRAEQTRLASATQAVQAEAPRLAAAEATQQAQAAALDQQIATAEANQKQAQGEATAAAQRAADAASRSDTLHGVLTELAAQREAEAERARDDAARAQRQNRADEAAAAQERLAAAEQPRGAGTLASAAQPHGQLTAPVAGTIVRGWGDSTAGGPANGISYRAAPAARVVSACSGRVAFAAQFRSYGLLLIVDCGGGYHTVLAGFERLDVKVGQNVAAGEPVGVMPGWDPAATGDRPTLYVELWRGGKPVNPAPWLKASG